MSDMYKPTYLTFRALLLANTVRHPWKRMERSFRTYVDEETQSISFFRSHNTDFFHQIATAMLLVVIWEPGLSLRCLSLSLPLSFSAPPQIQVSICIHDDDDTTLPLPLPIQSRLSCIRYDLTEAINGCHPTGPSIGVA